MRRRRQTDATALSAGLIKRVNQSTQSRPYRSKGIHRGQTRSAAGLDGDWLDFFFGRLLYVEGELICYKCA